MGQAVARLSLASKKLELTAAIERKDSPHLRKSYGSLIGLIDKNELALPLMSLNDLKDTEVDGLIDFSSPESTLNCLQQAEIKNIPAVIGTTGFRPDDIKKIQQFSHSIPILLSSNMSLGVNVLFWLVQKASKVLSRHHFDPEIVEIHHNQKQDAPSGTATTLEEIILHELGWDNKAIRHGRSGSVGKRKQQEVGSHAIRGGDMVGEHTVYFLGDGERIELTHRASHRNIFASGALEALTFLSFQKPGLYHMKDIFFLK